MKAQRSHRAEEWVFKTLPELMKFKSKLLVKKLCILYPGEEIELGDEDLFEKYYLWRTQYEKFKKLHLDTWEDKEKKRLKETEENDN